MSTETNNLYARHSVPGSGISLFQAALANFRFGGETAADTAPPLRVLTGEAST